MAPSDHTAITGGRQVVDTFAESYPYMGGMGCPEIEKHEYTLHRVEWGVDGSPPSDQPRASQPTACPRASEVRHPAQARQPQSASQSATPSHVAPQALGHHVEHQVAPQAPHLQFSLQGGVLRPPISRLSLLHILHAPGKRGKSEPHPRRLLTDLIALMDVMAPRQGAGERVPARPV